MVNYDSSHNIGYFRVRYDSRVVIYDRTCLIRLVTDWAIFKCSCRQIFLQKQPKYLLTFGPLGNFLENLRSIFFSTSGLLPLWQKGPIHTRCNPLQNQLLKTCAESYKGRYDCKLRLQSRTEQKFAHITTIQNRYCLRPKVEQTKELSCSSCWIFFMLKYSNWLIFSL